MTAPVDTSARDLLQSLVECDRYRDQYTRGLPVSGCLRRHLERQPGAKPGTLGPPKRPACAVCAKGREVAQRAQTAGIPVSTCATCGAALVGVTACEACDARSMGKRVPSGSLAGHAQPSTRIWNGEAPDAPLGPPPSAVVGLGAAGSRCVIPGCAVRLKKGHPSGVCATCRANGERGPVASVAEAAAAAVERVREAAPRVAPAVVNQEPAKPAERTETMARGIMSEPRTCCDSKGTKHKAWCKEAGGSGKPPEGKAKPALPPRPAKASKPARRSVRLVESAGFDVKAASVEKLVATIEACKLELLARKEALRKQLADFDRLIGEAAA